MEDPFSKVTSALRGVIGRAIEGDEKVIFDGYLHRQGIFKDWNKRFVELTMDALLFYTSKGGLKLGQFNLTASCQFGESSVRPFSFYLSDQTSGEQVYLSCQNTSTKESWKEHIVTQLTLLQKAHVRRLQQNSVDSAHETHETHGRTQIRNRYLARPLLYIKIIRARNLMDKDLGGTSDPYVQIMVGASTARTTTRKKTLDPEWGMVFNFDWDDRDRFARIEVWDEDVTTSADFLGVVLIPLYSLRDGHSSVRWYPLCKRSSRSHIRGEIEIEISCEGLPGLDPFVERFFREVQLLPCFQIPLMPLPQSNEDGGANAVVERCNQRLPWNCGGDCVDIRQAKGFPFFFPPCETEVLEDISVRASLSCQTTAGKVCSPGVLLLTNYRLLFLSRLRLLEGAAVARNPMLNDSDLSTQIPIGTICDVNISIESDATNQNDVLVVKTTDGRSLSFVFGLDDAEINSSSNTASSASLTTGGVLTPQFLVKLNGKRAAASIVNQLFVSQDQSREMLTAMSEGTTKSTVAVTRDNNSNLECTDSDDANSDSEPVENSTGESNVEFRQEAACVPVLAYVGVERAWDDLCSNLTPFAIDALDSPEGGPGFRMQLRVHLRKTSRHCERVTSLDIHSPLVELMQSSCIVSVEDREETDALRQLPLGWSSSRSEITSACDVVGLSQDETQLELLRLDFSLLTLGKRLMKGCDITTRVILLSNLENAWYCYDPLAEFQRMGVPDRFWRITEANVKYDVCPSYPALHAVPASIDDGTLMASAEFRSKNRFPSLCWRNKSNLCSITRCSQPMVGLRFQRSVPDEYFLYEISKCSGISIRRDAARQQVGSSNHPQYVIADARPLLNARANQAAGKGVETEVYYENANIVFLGIPNIHAVRKSYEALEEAVTDESNFASKLENSAWLINIGKVLRGAVKIVHCVAFENMSVVVHCSDGWDRTSQLTSLPMLMLDGYYRTLRGFIVLIEKEWLSFGHKFADRSGWGYDGFKCEERSPIFHQFLDCVFQIINQFPNSFEFNEDLLLFILEHLYTGWFGDFMFNCEFEKKECRNDTGFISMWAVVLNNKEKYKNPSYCPYSGVVVPVFRSARLVLWPRWFNAWQDRVWKAAWLQDCCTEESPTEETSSGLGTWVDDHSVIGCRRCQKMFTVYRRRHHCRRCGHIFCEKCASESRIVSQLSNWKTHRVCIDCARLLDSERMSKPDISADLQQPGASAKDKLPMPRENVKNLSKAESRSTDDAQDGPQSRCNSTDSVSEVARVLRRKSRTELVAEHPSHVCSRDPSPVATMDNVADEDWTRGWNDSFI